MTSKDDTVTSDATDRLHAKIRDRSGTKGMQVYRAKADHLRTTRNDKPMTDAEMKEIFHISDEEAAATKPKPTGLRAMLSKLLHG